MSSSGDVKASGIDSPPEEGLTPKQSSSAAVEEEQTAPINEPDAKPKKPNFIVAGIQNQIKTFSPPMLIMSIK